MRRTKSAEPVVVETTPPPNSTESAAATFESPGPPSGLPAEPPAASKQSGPALVADSACVEAIVFSVGRPVGAERIAVSLGLLSDAKAGNPAPTKSQTKSAFAAVEAAIAELNSQYEQTARSFRIESVAGGFRVMTLPKFAPVLTAFHAAQQSHKLSRAAVETLAIVAYKQPITRAQLEAIRGVACGEVLKTLLERRLVTIKGRAEELGRPMLYGTTKQFLDQFGLASTADLPTLTELKPTN
jgi:segregation and condensation protein B